LRAHWKGPKGEQRAFGHAPMVPHQSEKKSPKAFASASTVPKEGGEQPIPPWRSYCWSCNGNIFQEERGDVPEQSLSRRRDRTASRRARHAAFSHPIDMSLGGEVRGPDQPSSAHSARWCLSPLTGVEVSRFSPLLWPWLAERAAGPPTKWLPGGPLTPGASRRFHRPNFETSCCSLTQTIYFTRRDLTHERRFLRSDTEGAAITRVCDRSPRNHRMSRPHSV
jgi:hypothetical protein